jgi:vacuolar-type H+-ATPase subunit E/Vma4
VIPALEPVRLALMADAEAEADALVAEARARADDRVGRAEADAEAAVAEARRRAEAGARARAARELSRSRDDARHAELACRRELRDELATAVADALHELRVHPRYPELLDHLERVANDQLGPDATIVRDPQPDGGVLATAGGRRVDYRLPAIAERVLGLIADELENAEVPR